MSDTKPRKTDVQKLQRAIVDGLEDVKGQDIVVFNTELLSPLFERVIIASGTSNRQTKALASSVADAVREAGFPKPRIEGEDNGEWIIVDCGAAVAHVMQPTIRQYYHLEEIWGGKAVHLKSAAAKAAGAKAAATRAAKAPTASSADAAAPVQATPRSAGKPPAKVASKTTGKAITATAAAKTSAAKPASRPAAAGKTATAKTAVKTPTARKSAGTAAAAPVKVKTVVVGKPVAKKAAGKTATRKPAARSKAT
ncbi:MAG TPA: ribosome silencing factor [Burkholderiaceae bacterium]|nr:ribosome silencing factor [Burkholderiaceae bacterium]